MHPTDCICHKPPFSYLNYETLALGIVETNGHFAEVSIQTCKHCGTKWLNYFVEIEGFSSNIKWFKAIVEDLIVDSITTENALKYIEKARRYFYGGYYYGSGISIGSGKINVG